MDFISGEILYIDKPLGWTSFDAVKRVRGIVTRRLGRKKIKVGHAGTLDPLATGVMIVCTGRATKRIDELQAGVKEYIAGITLGATTPSFDLETAIDAEFPVDHISLPLVEESLKQFVGTIEQVPPSFSACKIDGRRAYKMARTGKEVNLKPKTLVIDDIEILGFDTVTDPRRPLLTIRVVCSKGTYIRALARDIGVALGSGAHLSSLRRTRVGSVSIDDCLSIDRVTALLAECPVTFPPDYDPDSAN